MRIRLGILAWKQLGLSDVDKKDPQTMRLELVRSSFYLGYNLLHISRIMEIPYPDPEAKNIIETAYALGMSDRDIVSFDEDYFP